MGLASTLARRSLLERPGRTLFSLLGIGLGIATVVAVQTLDHNTIAGLRLKSSPDWQPEIELRPAADLADPRAALNAIEGIAGSAAFFQNEVVLQRPGARPSDARGNRQREKGGRAARMRARLIAADSEALPAMDAYRLSAGEPLSPKAERSEVLIGAAVAARLGVEVGDELELSRPRRAPRRECVDGQLVAVDEATRKVPIAIRFLVKGVLAPEKLGRRANGEVVLVDYSWGRTLYEDARINERYWVRPDPSVDIEGLQASLASSFSYDIGRSVVIGRAADERAFRNGVLMAGLLGMVLGLYVIFHTLSTSLVERVVEIGTLNALGATRAQIARVLLLEAVGLSFAGGIVGLGGGILVAWMLLRQGITTLGSGIQIDSFDVPWGYVLPAAALGMTLALAGSVFPLLRARGTNTVEALRGQRTLESSSSARGFNLFAAVLLAGILPALYFAVTPVVGETTAMLVGATLIGVGVLGLLVAVPFLVPRWIVPPMVACVGPVMKALLPFAGRMAAHTMRADPRRVAVATAAIALVAAALVGLKGMTRSLAGEIESWSERAVADKIFVEGLPQVPFDGLSEALHELPEVVAVEAGSARIFSPFLILGLRVDELRSHGPLKEDPRLVRELERRHGIVLSERLARNLGYDIGDRVQLETGSGVQQFRVVAISDAYGYFPRPDERMYGVVSDRVMKQLFCLDIETVERVAVRLKPGGDPLAVTAVVQDFVGGESSIHFEEGDALLAAQVADIDQDFRLFDVLLFLTAVLAAIGVLNGQLLSALEREKELGILKALGASRGQVARMVLLESALVGIAGGAVGAGIGVLLSPMILRSLELLSGLALPDRGAGGWVLFTLIAAPALSITAALYPIWRMNRTDAVKSVRTG